MVIPKFTKSLTNSLLIKPGQSNKDLDLINDKSHQASILMTKKTIQKDAINLKDYSAMNCADIMRACKKEFLRQHVDKDNNKIEDLKKHSINRFNYR